MPVVRRPRKQRGPSGLQQFLQGLSTAVNVGSNVASFLQQRRFADIQESRNALQQEEMEQDRATRLLAMGVNAAESARNKTLAELASQGEDVPIESVTAAPTLGDIPNPVQRTATRRALQTLGVEEPGDNFVLSPTNIQEAGGEGLEGVTQQIREFRRLRAQARGGDVMDQAARTGEISELSGGVLEDTPQAIRRRIASERKINELMRVSEDPETGEVNIQGPAANTPVQTINQFQRMRDGEPLKVEFDPSEFGLEGQARNVDPSFYEDLFQAKVESALSREETRHQEKATRARNIASELNISFQDAMHAVNGNYDQMEEGNEQLFRQFRKIDNATVELLGQASPAFRRTIELGKVMREQWGVPREDMAQALKDITKLYQETAPEGAVIVRDPSMIERAVELLPGTENPVFRFQSPTKEGEEQTDPAAEENRKLRQGRGGGLPSDTLDTQGGEQPDQTAQNRERVNQAFQQAMQSAAQILASTPPEQRRERAREMFLFEEGDTASAIGLPDPVSGDTLRVEITEDDINRILEQLEE